jgi:hypothetical protein
MNDKRLRWQLTKLEPQRRAPNTRVANRPDEQVPIARPVVVMPTPHKTAEEWLAKYHPEASHG